MRCAYAPYANLPDRLDALAGQQIVGPLPAGQGADAVEPGGEVRVGLRPVVAGFLGREEQVAGEGEVGDGGRVADNELGCAEVLLDDLERAVEAAFEEGHDGGVGL